LINEASNPPPAEPASSSGKKASLKSAIGIVVSVGLVAWMVGSLEWHAVGNHLYGMNWWPWIAALAILALHFVLRAWRWAWLLPGKPSDHSLLLLADTNMIGNLATYILPLRAGEFIRPAAYAHLTQTKFLPAFTTVVVERLFDLVAVLLSLAAVMIFFPGVPTIITQAATVLGVGAVVLATFVVLGALRPEMIRRLIGWVAARLPSKIGSVVVSLNEQILAGVESLREPRRLGMVLFQTALVWGTAYAQFWICLFVFEIPNTSWLMAVTVAVVLALGVAAPSAPGFVGVYQVSCLLGFRLFGVSDELAAAYAITTHAFQYVVVIGYGGFALFKYDLNLKELMRGKT
jgi:uncharacterized protein (TIRG00374 family)